jgi:hypothetical protein
MGECFTQDLFMWEILRLFICEFWLGYKNLTLTWGSFVCGNFLCGNGCNLILSGLFQGHLYVLSLSTV